MENKLNEEEVKKAIKEAEEKMKLDADIFKSQRKAALTWNIIFFVGILSTSIAISIFTKFDTFDFKNFIKDNSKDSIGIFSAILGIIASFLTGILGSYYKTKQLRKETTFAPSEFLKETYLNRLNKSNLNPQR